MDLIGRLAAGRAATTRIKSSSPSLYRHSFGDFSDRAAPKMAEVKRSLSAAETRHGARHETSTPQIHHPSSLGRSASSLQTSARRPLLHPYTTISQSRALMYGPSTPSPNGASRLVDEVPATPTPASKYHSDKSRGKRKADDIDTTPPDQKKDGQRATFLIPPETRSKWLFAIYVTLVTVMAHIKILNAYEKTKASEFLIRRMRRLRTIENVRDCRPPLLSLPRRNHDRRRSKNKLGAVANISLGRVVLALVAPLAHLRVLHPLIHIQQNNIYLTVTKNLTTVASPCRKYPFQSVLLSHRMHPPFPHPLNSTCEILESLQRNTRKRNGGCILPQRMNRVRLSRHGYFLSASSSFPYGG